MNVGTQRGFTLLEVLIASAVFAVVGMLAYSGYNELNGQSERLTANMKRVRAVQVAVMRFTQDFSELEPRPIREPIGSTSRGALLADQRTNVLVEFTRAGWSNPAAIQRPTLQRVAYRLEDNKLYRDHWLVMDRTLASEPVKVELLDEVRRVRLRFMDFNRTWHEAWPPQGIGDNRGEAAAGSGGGSDRPLAVEVTVELNDWGTLTRIIEVPG